MQGILVLVVDCLRADRAERAGAPWPTVRGLADGGTRFAAAYTTCPTTTPAIASMLTGRYPAAHGVRALRGARLAEGVPTVAEELARAGWATWCSVTGPLMDNVHVARGFAEAEYRDVPERSVYGHWGRALPDRLRALRDGGRPFFAFLHVWDLHGPRRYPPAFDRRRFGRHAYDRALAALDPWIALVIEAVGPETLVVLTGDHGENLRLEPRSLTQQRYSRALARRLPTKEWTDRLVLRAARGERKLALRLAPRQLWPHGQTLLEELVRVPLVFAGPGVAPGVRATPVSHVDLAPTLLDLAGVEHPPEGWQGTSLAASVTAAAEPPARPLALETAEGVPAARQFALRDGPLKLIAFGDGGRDALYDLEADPRERRNLARRRPDDVARLRAELDAVLAETAEPEAMTAEDEAILTARLEELGYL